MNRMNLKKFVKERNGEKLPRFAVLEFVRLAERYPFVYEELWHYPQIRLITGKSEKNSEVVWHKAFDDKRLKKISFKVDGIKGFMFRVLSDRIYIREELKDAEPETEAV